MTSLQPTGSRGRACARTAGMPTPAGPLRALPAGAAVLDARSVFAPARDRMLRLARGYPVDRVLAVFRANAGLDTRGAEPPGTWEGFGHPEEEPWGEHDYPGRERARTANLLRGHYAGHMLSMLAKAHAATGEEVLRERAHALVEGLAEVQSTLAATGRYSHPGFLAAYGEWQFSRLEDLAPYGEIWAPYYTAHKIMAGLLDAYELTGSSAALEVLEQMAHWVHGRLAPLHGVHRQRMWSLYIAGEFGGMNETLARLADVTGNRVHLETARFFDQENLLEAGSGGRDVLDGMHANQHLPQLLGYVHEHALTGEERYLETARTLFEQVVPGRMFAHGGTGQSELWGPPGTVAGNIGHRNAETCAAYNLVKLARLLLARTGDALYADYIERTLTNQVLGSRRAVDSAVSPEVTYMFPVHPGAVREYDNVGTCCGGTGLENHVTHQDALALTAPGTLWIVLLTDCVLDWEDQGLRLRLRTEGPAGGRVTIRIERAPKDGADAVVRVYVPRWAAPGSRGAVRAALGRPEDGIRLEPGTFTVLERRWRTGDQIELDLPAGVVSTPTVDDPDLHSLSVGSTVLLARSDRSTTLHLPLRGLRRLDGTLTGIESAPGEGDVPILRLAGLELEPAWSGGDARYHMYVRAADDEIAFAGRSAGVAERPDPRGTTLLQEVWADPQPTTREAFLERVLAVVQGRTRAGLLSARDARQVLTTAVLAEIDGTGSRRAESADDEIEALVARLPEVDPHGIPPLVRLVVDTDPAPSGWHTEPSRVRVEVAPAPVVGDTPAARAAVRLRVDSGPWQDGAGPVDLPEGEHRVQAHVRTDGGLEARAERVVSVDTQPPTSTARWNDLGSAWEITLDADDAHSGVDRIQWEGPGTFWGTFHESFVRALTDEEQIIEYAAIDRAGNQEPRRRLVLPARGAASA